jgi:hypothetical protein
MATVTVSPASPRATIDVCTVTVADAPQNTTGVAETAPAYPPVPFTAQAEAEIRYYLTFEEDSVEKARSYVFGVDEGGDHVFPSFIFPDAGTYVVHLRLEADNSSVANSGNVTVQ